MIQNFLFFFDEVFLDQSRSEETSPYKVIKTNDLICFLLIYLAYHPKSGGSGEEKDLQGRKVFFWTCVVILLLSMVMLTFSILQAGSWTSGLSKEG